MNYSYFLLSKIKSAPDSGVAASPDMIHEMLFPFQRHCVRWALKKGRAAIWAAMGLGKTFMQVEWARLVPGSRPVLIVAPLAVAEQTIEEAAKLGVKVVFVRSQAEVAALPDARIFIANYEMVYKGHFSPEAFGGLVLDESSILKAYTGRIKQYLISAFKDVPFRLACSATPSPNDIVELGNHAEFLGIMSSGEMLTRWFIRDSQNANNLRLKRHSVADFWRWVASWAVCFSLPSHLNADFDDAGYILPELKIIHEKVDLPLTAITSKSGLDDGQVSFLPNVKHSATAMHREKRDTLAQRIARVKEIVNRHPDEPVLIWHKTNAERDAIAAAIPDAVTVTGEQKLAEKVRRLKMFSSGECRILSTKAKIAGHGLNWQHCAVQIHASIDHKFEEWWQAVGRSWRFGQARPVRVYLVFAETEAQIIKTLQEKRQKHDEMTERMIVAMKNANLDSLELELVEHTTEIKTGQYHLMRGDCVQRITEIPDNSVGLTVSSWPFSDQYMYSTHLQDFGNCDGEDDFFNQMDFLIPEILRVTMPGRLAVVHAKDRIVYGTKTDHGCAYIDPFSDRCAAAMVKHGFLPFGRITISTDVVRENTHTHRLTNKEMRKDGSKMNVGMPEYLLLFRKLPSAGNGATADVPVTVGDDYSLARWQVDANSHWRSNAERLLYPWEAKGYNFEAHIKHLENMDERGDLSRCNMSEPIPSDCDGVWTDIRRTDVLNGKAARDADDEKHICPLQLDLIKRCIERWSNPGETVLDYFGGVMSVPYVAVQTGRFGMGIELKESYYETGARYCKAAAVEASAPTFFDLMIA